MENFDIWAILSQAVAALAPIFLAVLSAIGVYLAQLIRARVKHEYWAATLTRLNDTILTVVREVGQTMAEEIKAASADGKLTDQEKADIRAHALAKIKSYLGLKGLAMLARILGIGSGSMDDFLVSKIEATLKADSVAKRSK